MCSTCDCDSAKIEPVLESDSTTCRKCGADAFIVIDRVHVECRDCYLESCNKKIRSTIGKSRLLKNNDPILVAYSGGPSSTTLLDLIRTSMESETRREQKFRPSILHIDVQSVIENDPNTLKSTRLNELTVLLERTHNLYPEWPLYWTVLELSAVPSYSEDEIKIWYNKYDPQDPQLTSSTLLDCSKTLDAFRAATKNLDLTDRQQYVHDRTMSLIDKVADEICSSFHNETDKFKYVFTATSGTQLANHLLVDVILGRGASMYHTVSICDTRARVPFVRPMRDFSKKEVAFYLKARNLHSTVQVNLSTFAESKSSIQTLTEAFLSKLSVDYPSTYRTLLRTGDKMQD